MCGCGLYAYYEPAGLEAFATDGDVWGAVLAWGRVEAHSDGFRSEWQRPLALAAAPATHGARAKELARAASLYRVPSVAWQDVESIAREHGDPVPCDLVPVQPLALLGSRWSWRSLPPAEDELPDSTMRDLAAAINRGSVLACHGLAGFGADLAFKAAYHTTAGNETALRRLEVGLIALLAAAKRWIPAGHEPPTGLDERRFRGHAEAWIARALDEDSSDWGLAPPTTLTWGRIHELTDALLSPSIDTKLGESRPSSPLDEQQFLSLLLMLARHEPATRGLVDELWYRVRFLRPAGWAGDWWRTAEARRFLESGSRSKAAIRSLVFAEQYVGNREKHRALLRTIASHPDAAPVVRAEALGELAADGPLEASVTWLEHPCASVWSATDALARHGAAGKTAARAMLSRSDQTDTQLCACIAALGAEAASVARDRLASRPAPMRPLLRQCVKALPPDEAGALITARITNGEAVANGEWWAAISELPTALQEPVARALLARLERIPPDDRFFALEQALDAALGEQPSAGPTALQQTIRKYVLAADDLNDEDREWLLTQHARYSEDDET